MSARFVNSPIHFKFAKRVCLTILKMAAVMTRAQMMVEHGAQDRQLIWYSVQRDAMQRATDLGGMFVFSRDKRKGYKEGTEPVKQYAACSLRMIHRYMNTRAEAWHRCVYEILRGEYPDGTPVASKLNVDVDISVDDCDDFMAKGQKFHEHFVADLRAFLAQSLGEPDFLDESKTPMVVMDSSTPRKFSMHYVLGGIMFENNYHVGAMMRTFREHVIEKYGMPATTPDHPYFFSKKAVTCTVDGRAESFAVDLAIYTVNRAFRLLGNCKFSKKVMLIPFGMDRAEQYTRTFTFDELRASIVQDPILAETCKIYSVKEMDGSVPRSQSVSRKMIVRDPSVLAERRGRILTAEEMRTPRMSTLGGETVVRVPMDVSAKLCAALQTLLPRITLSPGGVKYKAHLGEFVVPQATASLYCYLADRNHTNAASYLAVSCSRGTYTVRCHKADCLAAGMHRKQESKSWSMPEAVRIAVDGFLASVDSSGQKPVALGPICALVLDAEKKIPADYVHVPSASEEYDYVAAMDLDLDLGVPESQERIAWD